MIGRAGVCGGGMNGLAARSTLRRVRRPRPTCGARPKSRRHRARGKRCHQDRGKAKGRGCLAGRRFTGCRKGRGWFLDGTACDGSMDGAGRGQNLILGQEIEHGTWLGREIPAIFSHWHRDCFARDVHVSVDWGGAGRAALPMRRHNGGMDGR